MDEHPKGALTFMLIYLVFLTENGLEPVEASGIYPQTRKRFPRL